jgi:hypothetical protein
MDEDMLRRLAQEAAQQFVSQSAPSKEEVQAQVNRAIEATRFSYQDDDPDAIVVQLTLEVLQVLNDKITFMPQELRQKVTPMLEHNTRNFLVESAKLLTTLRGMGDIRDRALGRVNPHWKEEEEQMEPDPMGDYIKDFGFSEQ